MHCLGTQWVYLRWLSILPVRLRGRSALPYSVGGVGRSSGTGVYSPRRVHADHRTEWKKINCFDPSLAPPSKSVVTIVLLTSYDYWQRIYGRSLYHAEQIQESDLLIDQLEQFYPGIKADIEFVDVATPLSYERYTDNWQGSNCGWLLTKRTFPLMLKGIRKTLPGLNNFYMIGQWVEPGGSVPIAAMSGRNVVQQICREDKRTFTTSIPSLQERPFPAEN
jgi:phytoene dehydrogenase-like protein